jgi:soluble cytochrome b562
MMNKTLMTATLIATLGFACNPTGLFAEDADKGEKTESFKTAATFAAAMKEIDEHYEEISKLIAAGKLDDVHKAAAAVQYHALTLAKLAMAADSGVPHENVKGINLTGKELAGKFDAIDATADAGKVPETKAVYDQMGTLIAKLKSLSAAPGK